MHHIHALLEVRVRLTLVAYILLMHKKSRELRERLGNKYEELRLAHASCVSHFDAIARDRDT